MQVHIRLFAALREAVGQLQINLELPPGATPEDVWNRLAAEHPALASKRGALTVAVNRKYAAFDRPLADSDEVVFIPPVSGG